MLFRGDGFDIEEYNKIVSPVKSFVILDTLNRDWMKLSTGKQVAFYRKLDFHLYYKIEKTENPNINYYFVFRADGKWKPRLVCTTKIAYCPGAKSWKIVWNYVRGAYFHTKELGVFRFLTEARKKVKSFANSLPLDQLIYSEFLIIDVEEGFFREKYISRFCRSKDGATLYTFLGAGVFYEGAD